ncbi:MAG: tetratricopeptide repeat protein [Acidobacteria bacterium]|nr:tetratricopeptide repeat protein [Acidobacteriota bacterium]
MIKHSLKNEKQRVLASEAGWLPISVILLLTFLAYSGTLWFHFVYDDRGQILADAQVHYWRFAPHFFAERVWSFAYPNILGNYYRPVFLLYLLINYKIFGPYPAGWHLVSVGVQVVVTFLVYRLVRRIVGDRKTALIAALIFGLTPVHIESVAWISGVTDPLMALFLLPSFLCYLSGREPGVYRRWWLAASLTLYGLATLSKETALILPMLIFAFEWLWQKKVETASRWKTMFTRIRASLLPTIPFVLLTVAYLAARWNVLKGLGHSMTPLAVSTIILTWPKLLWFYLMHLIWPFGLSVFYDMPYIKRPGLESFFLPLAGLIAVGVGAWLWARRLEKTLPSAKRMVAFACVWLLLPFVPLLDLSVLPVGEIAHDRYLYLPSIGFSILVAMAIRRLKQGSKQFLGLPVSQAPVVVALSLVLAIGTALQDRYWANDLTLYSRGVMRTPDNLLARTNLGNALGEKGYYAQAINLYRQVLARDPRFWLATYNMGYTYYKMGRLREAERYLEEAIAINGVDSDEYFYLGLTWLKLGHVKQAAQSVRHAIELQPDGFAYHFAMGLIFELEHNPQGALQEFKKELKNFPGETGALQQIEAIRAEQGSSIRK